MALSNLWNDAEAAKYAGYDELVYRANILGQDPSVTNWKGGNISGKYTEKDFDGTEIQVLRVKGSGSDLRTAVHEDFVGVKHAPVLKLWPREKMVAPDDLELGFVHRYASSRRAEDALGWKPAFTFGTTAADQARDLEERGLL